MNAANKPRSHLWTVWCPRWWTGHGLMCRDKWTDSGETLLSNAEIRSCYPSIKHLDKVQPTSITLKEGNFVTGYLLYRTRYNVDFWVICPSIVVFIGSCIKAICQFQPPYDHIKDNIGHSQTSNTIPSLAIASNYAHTTLKHFINHTPYMPTRT